MVMSYWGVAKDAKEVSELLGKTLRSVERVTEDGDDSLVFVTTDDVQYIMWHEQDCCESVYIEDIVGNLDDLVGSPLTLANEASNREDDEDGSCTWTFYKFATVKGYVDIRWCGTSNGYYSESVSFAQLT
jgi:hypothetical protein